MIPNSYNHKNRQKKSQKKNQKEQQHTDTVQEKQRVKSNAPDTEQHSHLNQNGLNTIQQHFVLKFCRQLASVIQACEQSETAEIEIGRRQIGAQQVRVKLRAKRELQ